MTMQYDNLEDKLSQLVEYTKDSGKIDLSLDTILSNWAGKSITTPEQVTHEDEKYHTSKKKGHSHTFHLFALVGSGKTLWPK